MRASSPTARPCAGTVEIAPDWTAERRDLARTVVLDEMYAALLERVVHPDHPTAYPRARARAIATLLVGD